MATCKDCLHSEACEGTYRYYDDEYIDEVSSSGDVRDLCTIFKNKADFVEVVRCKDCILYEEGCPLDTHPYMTADDGYCYLGKRTPKERGREN